MNPQQATDEDRPSIAALFREAGWESDPVFDEAWVAYEGDHVVGAVTVIEAEPNTAFIDAVVVASNRRGCGIGTDLLQAALSARDATWWLECREELLPFYTSTGFEVAADVPASVRALVAPRTDRAQNFLRRVPGSARSVG